MWRQRSRVLWLTAGDKNTRFFHLRASRRRSRNKISRLRKPNGQFTEVDLKLRAIVTNFYSNLFAFESTDNMEEVLSTVLVKVTPEMNRTLLDPYKEGEVKDALFQMFLTKAPGPDGFPAHFFQRHWELCGKEVTAMVLKLLNGEEEPTDPLACAMLYIKLHPRCWRIG